MVVLTQNVCGHPASFDAEAEHGSEHQDGDVARNDSHRDSCDKIYHAGQEKTLNSAKPAEKRIKEKHPAKFC